MNSKITFFFLLAIISFGALSCKKELSGVSGKSKDITTLKITPLDFNYLTARSKIRFQDTDTDITLSANIRMKKDSIIWLSLSPAFGIEAARGIITQDSLIILNRLNQEYMAYDFKSLSEKLNFNISFDLIQAMLLGDMPITQSLNDEITEKNGHFIIHQKSGEIMIDNFINAAKMKTERVQLSDQPTQNTLTLLYSDFQPLMDTLIPYSNKIVLNYQNNKERQTTLIEIDHGKAEIATTSLEFPFNIPKKYDRK